MEECPDLKKKPKSHDLNPPIPEVSTPLGLKIVALPPFVVLHVPQSFLIPLVPRFWSPLVASANPRRVVNI